MPVYHYKALNKQGKTVRGLVDADGLQRARQRLRADGLYPVEINPASKGTGRGGRPARKKSFHFRSGGLGLLANTTRQLATLLVAGLPLVTALSTIQEQTEDEGFNHLLAMVREEITGGESLASALAKHPHVFPMDYVQLVRAGEMAGALDQVLERLASSLELKQKRRASITSALAYPAFMTLVGGGVLFFLLSFIVPTLTGLFENLGAALPLPTRILLATSGVLSKYWWAVLLLLISLVVMFRLYVKKETNYRKVERVVFRIPVLGSLMQRLRLAQALRGLSVMTGGGVPLSSALGVTAQGMGRSVFGQALKDAADLVGQGRSLAAGLEASGLFPPVARQMVAVGESSGTLTDMLGRVAKTYEDETDRVLATLTSLVEPVIILLMGLMVGFVVLAVLLPIFDLSGLVG